VRRKDVVSLRTVAGNLDTEAVNRYHHVSAMPGSRNPIDAAEALAGVPQVHFIGAADSTVRAIVAAEFAARTRMDSCLRIVTVEGASHETGWSERWPELLGQTPSCPPD
jgi:hypothetical protein